MSHSTSSQPLSKPEFSRESRLGLVVYGGAALAIYMNGICREFYNAVRGRGIYKLIKALTDSDIIVDIISGTSAGGVNGVFLSYALANSNRSQGQIIEFEKFANIWRNSGNIHQLLRQVNPRNPNSKTDSFFDGKDYYQKELASSFCKLWSAGSDAPKTDWVSEFNELDLFVTGTDTLGKVEEVLDNTGRVIEVKNHRTVFILKHRQGRKEPFKPHSLSYHSLAKLCRITSCLPVAFPVVTLAFQRGEKLQKREYSRGNQEFVPWNDLGTGGRYQVDRELILWGDLENRNLPYNPPNYEDGKQEYRLYFLDGGLLDNRPFSYAIKEMYYRLTNRPVERKLFYIDPNPDQFINSPAFKKMQRPNSLKVLEYSLGGLSIYESITNDLELIKERNQRIRRYQTLLSTHHLSNTMESLSEENSSSQLQEEIYLHSRLVGLCDRLLPLIINCNQEIWSSSELNLSLDEIAQCLKSTQNSSSEPQEINPQQVCNLDIDYALRRHFFIIELIQQKLSDLQGETSQQNQTLKVQLQSLLKKFGRQIKLLEILQYALENLFKQQEVGKLLISLIEDLKKRTASSQEIGIKIREYFILIYRLFLIENATISVSFAENELSLPLFTSLAQQAQEYSLQSQSDWLPQETLSEVLEELKRNTAELIPKIKANQSSSTGFDPNLRYDNNENNSSILLRIEEASYALINYSQIEQYSPELQQELLNKFTKFRQFDQVLYPFEYLTDLQEKDLIELIRISPDDAQRGYGRGKSLGSKLAGDNLYSLGGFFKKSWRSNDILWGRLDGLNRIVDALITPESLPNFSQFLAGKPFEKSQLTQEEYLRALVQDSFPSSPESQEEIVQYLQQLANLQGNIADFPLEEFRDKLVLAGHREILNTDLEEVVEDAILEQFEWNQQSVVEDAAFNKVLKKIKFNFNEEDKRDELNLMIQNLLQVNSQQQLKRFFQEKGQARPNFNPETYLNEIIGRSFPNLAKEDVTKIAEYPLKIVSDNSKSWVNSIEQLQEFITRLMTAGQQTLRTVAADSEIAIGIQNRKPKLQGILQQINPQYLPVSGYYDRMINPLAAKELARQNIANSSLAVKEDFFRNQYLVGSETLSRDIPAVILANLSVRTILILRDILVSLFGGKIYQGLVGNVFQFLDKPVQFLYWWLQVRGPYALRSQTFQPRLSFLFWLRLLLSLVGIAGIGYIFYFMSKSPNLSIAGTIVAIAGGLFLLLGFIPRD